MNNRVDSFFCLVNGTYQVFCPAKINLYLKVCGKRGDGYHELETLFQEIDLGDLLEYAPIPGDLNLVVNGPPLGPLDDNLVLRAARLFSQATGIQVEGRFTLSKRVPPGGGLGGGSSNAAATLKLLNQINDLPLGQEALGELALRLGSDVPFFLKGGCQMGSGRGEVLKPSCPPSKLRRGFLLLPELGLSTALVFSHWRPHQRDSHGSGRPELGRNDLLEPVLTVSPEMAKIWSELKRILPQETLFMTGSGSTLVWLTDRNQANSKLLSMAENSGINLLKFAFRQTGTA